MLRDIFLVPLALLIALAPPAMSADWTRFRGPNGSGVSTLKGIPTTWSPGDYTFNIMLPGEGHGAAVIHGRRLFVTSAIDAGRMSTSWTPAPVSSSPIMLKPIGACGADCWMQSGPPSHSATSMSRQLPLK